LQFEHLVEVNGSEAPFALSREALWSGLLRRAEDARPFLPGLESCRIIERQADALVRELRFGQSLVRDRACWHSPNWIRFEADTAQEHAGGSLTISIEESEEGKLFLRFCYLTNSCEADGENQKYSDFIRSAWCQSDFDTLHVIRKMASSGKLL
jgi:hypothetical protein